MKILDWIFGESYSSPSPSPSASYPNLEQGLHEAREEINSLRKRVDKLEKK